jgi:hypothetical protein
MIKGVCPHLFFIVVVLTFGGCAKIQHLDEALTLKAYSDEKDAQARQVSAQDKKFEELLALSRSGKLAEQYRQKSDIISAFGQPIVRERILDNAKRVYERFLYRYATHYFDSPKVYVVFDDKNIVYQLDVVEPEKPGAGHGQP